METATALTAIRETAIALAMEITTQTVMTTVIPVAIAMETMEIPVTVFLATKAKAAENKKNSKKTTLQQIKDMV